MVQPRSSDSREICLSDECVPVRLERRGGDGGGLVLPKGPFVDYSGVTGVVEEGGGDEGLKA